MIKRILRMLGFKVLPTENHDPDTGSCTFFGDHEWQSSKDQPFKRKCRGCGSEEWLFTKRFPAIGEAKHSWRNMDTDHLKFL